MTRENKHGTRTHSKQYQYIILSSMKYRMIRKRNKKTTAKRKQTKKQNIKNEVKKINESFPIIYPIIKKNGSMEHHHEKPIALSHQQNSK
jgi:hypothetical protein